MGWQKGTREIVYERQGGVCAICGEFTAKKDMVLHHVKNKRRHGESTPDNAQGRCITCERIAHKVHKEGNPPYWRVLAWRP